MSTYILRKGVSTLSDLANGGVAAFPFGTGRQFYLDPTNGADGNDGTSPDKAFKTFTTAYAALTSGQNDTLFYIPGATGITLSAALVWSKSYTHFIGLCAPTQVAQRARIFQLSTLTAASPLITISGSGCIFANLYIFQGVADATSLINVSVTGDRNYFENVHFAGGGHVTQAVDGGASLLLNGGDENTFVGCTVGVDTVAAATGMTNLQFDGSASRNKFKECMFLLYAGNAGAAFVEIVDNDGIGRFNLFDDCVFINSARAASLTSGFVIPADMASLTNFLLVKDCMILGTAKLDANDRGVLYGNMNDVTGADTSGVAVEMIS
jgi:hypothetical protein